MNEVHICQVKNGYTVIIDWPMYPIEALPFDFHGLRVFENFDDMSLFLNSEFKGVQVKEKDK